MDIVDIINLYNPKFSPSEESVFMVPVEYVEEVRRLANEHKAEIQIFQKRKSKYVYVKWSPGDTNGRK